MRKIFLPLFFHDSSPSGTLTNLYRMFFVLFRFRWDIQSQSKTILTPWCTVLNMTPLSELPLLMLKISLPIINELTHKVILPDCPFKSIQRPATILDSDSALCILSPQCHAHHGGSDSAVGKIPRRFFLKKSWTNREVSQNKNFSAKSNPYSKIVFSARQGPQMGLTNVRKNEVKKPRDTVYT